MKMMNAAHPGEILQSEFIEPYGLSSGRVAKALSLPRTRIERLVKEETGMTTDTAVRLAKFFRTSPMFWMNLQTQFDLAKTECEIDVSSIPRYEGAAA
ncbi:HigA family addiction module antitoxin [Aliisedimentitalea scapharcae]|uniref:HigA family addiction module antitoxin n=1 Tax=Aliisedimentitalea scapharcae TaxID=1524259 RepID=A0ABZ2XUG8_9RHOB